jgi:hypothetical protein
LCNVTSMKGDRTHVCTWTTKLHKTQAAREDVNKTFNFRFSVSFTRKISTKLWTKFSIWSNEKHFIDFPLFRLCLWWVLLTFWVSITDSIVVANFRYAKWDGKIVQHARDLWNNFWDMTWWNLVNLKGIFAFLTFKLSFEFRFF